MTARTGATLKEIMARLGQSSTRATMIYQHATSERDREIAEALNLMIAEARAAAEDATEQPGYPDGDAPGGLAPVAGRGARGNAGYRDIVRTSLIVDAQFLALLLPLAYRHQSSGREIVVRAYEDARAQLDAIYASERLRLPFTGTLLVGY